MAVGFSGSNGGITNNQQLISANRLNCIRNNQFLSPPLEISYFVNNTCNLRCCHCYVGYNHNENELSEIEWINVFEQCLKLGALTFGNVGKEPTLSWDKSISLFRWLAEKKFSNNRLRFGLVTNAILLDEKKSTALATLNPDYLDISLDGIKETHDVIRGRGSYNRTIRNIRDLPPNLRDKVFISFTANESNIDSLPKLIKEIIQLDIKNILISPYIAQENQGLYHKDILLSSDQRLMRVFIDLIESRLVDFSNMENFSIYIKNDYSTSFSLMEALLRNKIIDLNNLWEDDYGVIFTPYEFGTNRVYFNYLPFDHTFRKAIRFSHDGFISNCHDMFFRNYPERAIGNIRSISLSEFYQALISQFPITNYIYGNLPTISSKNICFT